MDWRIYSRLNANDDDDDDDDDGLTVCLGLCRSSPNTTSETKFC